MTTQTKLYTLPQLCARLGIKIIGKLSSNQEPIQVLWAKIEGGQEGTVHAILSVGDKIGMDECECGHHETSHVKGDESVWQAPFCDDCGDGGGCNRDSDDGRFKPLLLKITAIRFVEGERCGNCDGVKGIHKNGLCNDFGAPKSMQFKPVQMVEITIKKKED